jgi:hypothetical protein
MKRTGIILSILFILGVTLGAGIARADTTTITITVTIQSLSISVTTGGTWTISTPQATSATVTSSVITVQNTGNMSANLALSVTDTTGGGATLWTAGSAVNSNTFTLSQGASSSGPWSNIVTVPSLATGLAAGATKDFYLQLQLPSSVSGTGAHAAHTLTVTITSS